MTDQALLRELTRASARTPLLTNEGFTSLEQLAARARIAAEGDAPYVPSASGPVGTQRTAHTTPRAKENHSR